MLLPTIATNYSRGTSAGPRRRQCNNLGFSIVEMMIALAILSISILALTTVTLTSIKTNLRNDMRNTAIRLTNEKAEELLAQNFADIASSGPVATVVPLRGASKTFNVTCTVTKPTDNLRQITITVDYDWPGQTPPPSNTTVIFRHKAI
jgi:prepilin-type N-terminal cleavage/methylation domain-containing protein